MVRKNIFFTLLFFTVLLSVSYYYGYHEVLFKKPQSIHGWRQADNASLALNYYQYGFNFFKPEVHNLTMNNGTSGNAATSEIPCLYYAVALLYKLFGHQEFLFRGTVVLLYFTGLFFLYRLFQLVIPGDQFWPMALSLLFFTSPVLVYYGNNYLTEVPAFSMAILAIFFFTKYSFDKKLINFVWSMVFFTFAGSLKITALIPMFGFGAVLLSQSFFQKSYQTHLIMRPVPLKFTGFLLPLLLPVAWIIYAAGYNKAHEGHYFLTKAFPIWDLSWSTIMEIRSHIFQQWFDHYFSIPVHVFFMSVLIFVIWKSKYANAFLLRSLGFIGIISITYVLLLFKQFRHHDYYAISLFFIPLFVLLAGFQLFSTNYRYVFKSPWMKLGFAAFLIFNIYHAREIMALRYDGWMNNYHANKDFHYVSPYLRSIGIEMGDTVIAMPDGSHQLLYLTNLRGWTNYTDPGLNTGEKIHYNGNAEEVRKSISRGAKYLLINGTDILESRPYLKEFTHHLAGQFNNIHIYQLQGRRLKRPSPDTLFSAIFDAETRTADEKYFLASKSKALAEFGKLQSDESAYSGKFSARLDQNHPYAMTFTIPKARYGEKVELSAWVKDNTAKLYLVIAELNNELFLAKNEVVETKDDGWKKISCQWFVTPELNDRTFKVFLWYKGGTTAYADDLKINHLHHFNP